MGSEKIVRHPYRSKQTKTCVTDSTLQIQLAEEEAPSLDQANALHFERLADDEALEARIDKLKKNPSHTSS